MAILGVIFGHFWISVLGMDREISRAFRSCLGQKWIIWEFSWTLWAYGRERTARVHRLNTASIREKSRKFFGLKFSYWNNSIDYSQNGPFLAEILKMAILGVIFGNFWIPFFGMDRWIFGAFRSCFGQKWIICDFSQAIWDPWAREKGPRAPSGARVYTGKKSEIFWPEIFLLK